MGMGSKQAAELVQYVGRLFPRWKVTQELAVLWAERLSRFDHNTAKVVINQHRTERTGNDPDMSKVLARLSEIRESEQAEPVAYDKRLSGPPVVVSASVREFAQKELDSGKWLAEVEQIRGAEYASGCRWQLERWARGSHGVSIDATEAMWRQRSEEKRERRKRKMQLASELKQLMEKEGDDAGSFSPNIRQAINAALRTARADNQAQSGELT